MLQISAWCDGSVHANMFAKSRCCLKFTPARILLKKLLRNALFMALLRFLRLVSTQENYPWIGTDKEIFLCVKVISSNPELTRQRNIYCPFQSTDNFPECKLALN
jgi:hypothetical protein